MRQQDKQAFSFSTCYVETGRGEIAEGIIAIRSTVISLYCLKSLPVARSCLYTGGTRSLPAMLKFRRLLFMNSIFHRTFTVAQPNACRYVLKLAMCFLIGKYKD